MRKWSIVVTALCVCTAFALAASAQEKTLCERLGGTPAVSAVVEKFAGRVLKDDRINKKFGKAASSPCLRPGSTLALRGRGFHPALDQGDAHAPLEPQHKVPRPNGRGLNG